MEEKDSESLLTRRQVRVLRLRLDGCTQQEVAERLGTTRSNVSILEKRAHQNIQRARATLREWTMIQSPVSLSVPAGTDIFDLPRRIFDEADRRGIRLPINSLDVVVGLRSQAPELIQGRILPQEIEIYVTPEGGILVDLPPAAVAGSQDLSGEE
ncbi:MAG: Tfx family DNA-binding protein [Methanosarcinales archaeon]|nr:Tfx family DNA-binding protein [Methanosarcinales archaeon]